MLVTATVTNSLRQLLTFYKLESNRRVVTTQTA